MSIISSTFHNVRRFRDTLKLFGAGGVHLAILNLLGVKSEKLVRPPSAPRGLWVRSGSTDVDTFIQVFLHQEYQLPLPEMPRVIVDAGANIGAAAVYFSIRFPDAKIFALEPEAANFKQLEKNSSGFPNIVPIQAALWDQDGYVSLTDPGEGDWGFRVGQRANDVRAEAVTMSSLIRQYSIERVDVLKLDIEGSEIEVLSSSSEWIELVDNVIAELHDKYRPGCARAFYNATNCFNAETRRGENVLVSRSSPSAD